MVNNSMDMLPMYVYEPIHTEFEVVGRFLTLVVMQPVRPASGSFRLQ